MKISLNDSWTESLNFIHSRYNWIPNQVSLPSLMHFIRWLLVAFPPSIFLLFKNCSLSITPYSRPSCIYYAIFRALLLKHTLSKLHSILTFIPKEERDWNWREPFPRSVYISFYHVFFIEFLLDKIRLGEYWIDNQYYYTTLATKVLCLFINLYVMNGILQHMLFFSSDISCCKYN